MIDPARCLEILQSHGGRNDRWPAGERDGMLAVLRGNARLRDVRDEALRLDALLDEWAARDLGRGSDAGAAAARVLRPARPWLRWAAGGGVVAAALGAAVMVGPDAAPVAPVATATAAPTLSPAGAFTSLFTTMPDEEDVL